MKHLFSIIFLLISCFAFAQEKQEVSDDVNVDELGNVSDKFQEHFFQAISHKAIKNYEKAIEALEKCLEIKDDEPVLYVELGKNFFELKNYEKAEENFLKAIDKLQGKRKFYTQQSLLEVYEAQQNYEKGISLAQELSRQKPSYLETVANLLMVTKDYKKAIQALDELEEKNGFSERTDDLRDVIYKETAEYKQAINYYQNRVDNKTATEQTYLRLISFYNQNNQKKKVVETAKELEAINPQNANIQIIFSLIYLEKEDFETAKPYIKAVISNNAISEKEKMQVLEQVKEFVGDYPKYQDELLGILDQAILDGQNSASHEEKGNFYLSRDKEKALASYQKALEDKPNDFELLTKIANLQIELQQLDEAVQTTTQAQDVFPAQPVFYLLKGIALNALKNHKDAVTQLENGLDFLFDNPRMEAEFFQQLYIANKELGNDKKANNYQNKAIEKRKSIE
ncbi:MAG: tetratricopeptide repeat protein [Bacteroidota bacterium]